MQKRYIDKWRISIYIIFSFFTIFILAKSSFSHSVNIDDEQHVVVILSPSLSFQEIDWLVANSNSDIWDRGAYGAINLRPDGEYSYLNNIVSISTGKRAVGVMDWNAYEKGEEIAGEKVEKLFVQWNGEKPASTLIHPLFHRIKAKNESASFRADVGFFGEKLKENGIYTTVLGNADIRGERIRYGSLLIIDKLGEANGELYSIVDQNDYFPCGLLTNKRIVVDKVVEIQHTHGKTFTVVEWGDFHRLFSEKHNMNEKYFEKVYQQLLLHLQDLLIDLEATTKGDIWLISPNVHKDAYKAKNQLGPLWYWKNGMETFKLYSPTTRKTSLISNTDFVPTWLQSFHIKEDTKSISSVLQIEETKDWSYDKFQYRLEEIHTVFKSRAVVLSTYVSTLVILLLIVSGMILFLKEKVGKNIISFILLSAVLSPFLFLITSPIIRFTEPLLYVLIIILLSVIIAFFVKMLTTFPFSTVCFLFSFMMCFDVLVGGYFIERSYLGFDPIIGARYYGIGNEYAGVFIASSILMLSPIISLQKKKLTFIILSFTSFLLIVLLGASTFGANAGASFSIVIVFLFVVYQMWLKKYPIFIQLFLTFLLFLFMFALLYFLQLAQPESHIFIAYQQLLRGNFPYIFDMIVRKLQMNWKIFKISYWTQLFVTSYVLIGIMLWRRKKRDLTLEQSFLINCTIVASIGLLLLNDSGIVAAATSMFITISVYYGWKIKSVQHDI